MDASAHRSWWTASTCPLTSQSDGSTGAFRPGSARATVCNEQPFPGWEQEYVGGDPFFYGQGLAFYNAGAELIWS